MNKSSKNIIIVSVAVVIIVAIAISSIFILGKENAPVYAPAPEQSTSSTTESTTTTTTTETTTESTTKITPDRPNFYEPLNYRSPTAKPADIFKHGRNLMLLNNYYEIPEDFEWDLVYWSNGKSVDALSLNSEEYDTVVAVDRAIYEPLKAMFKDAADAGYPLQMVSAYRSVDMQDRRFTRSVNSYMSQGYSKEDAIAKTNFSRTFPGTSEHNVGLGVDILEKGEWYLTDKFENTETFKWLKDNAENYGFILRYNKDKIDITGIMYEPWHFRYVGVEHAKKINELGFCLEEYIEYLEA